MTYQSLCRAMQITFGGRTRQWLQFGWISWII